MYERIAEQTLLRCAGYEPSQTGSHQRSAVVLANDIEVAFGPVAGDRQTLSKAALATLDAI